MAHGSFRPRRESITYTASMPTPVGPVPPDPDDPDFWNWDDEDFSQPRRQIWRLVIVAVVVVGLILLLLVSVL
jgi:hypothetical protein